MPDMQWMPTKGTEVPYTIYRNWNSKTSTWDYIITQKGKKTTISLGNPEYDKYRYEYVTSSQFTGGEPTTSDKDWAWRYERDFYQKAVDQYILQYGVGRQSGTPIYGSEDTGGGLQRRGAPQVPVTGWTTGTYADWGYLQGLNNGEPVTLMGNGAVKGLLDYYKDTVYNVAKSSKAKLATQDDINDSGLEFTNWLLDAIPASVWQEAGVTTQIFRDGKYIDIEPTNWNRDEVVRAMRQMYVGSGKADQVSDVTTIFGKTGIDVGHYIKPFYVDASLKFGQYFNAAIRSPEDYNQFLNYNMESYKAGVKEYEEADAYRRYFEQLEIDASRRDQEMLNAKSEGVLKQVGLDYMTYPGGAYGDEQPQFKKPQIVNKNPSGLETKFGGMVANENVELQKLIDNLPEGHYKTWAMNNMSLFGQLYWDKAGKARQEWIAQLNRPQAMTYEQERQQLLDEYQRWLTIQEQLRTAGGYSENSIATGEQQSITGLNDYATQLLNDIPNQLRLINEQINALNPEASKYNQIRYDTTDPLKAYVEENPFQKEWLKKAPVNRGFYKGQYSPEARWLF